MYKYKQLIFGILIGALLFGAISAVSQTKIIQAELSDIVIKLNGNVMQLDDPPIMYNDRTYLPVRKIAEAVGKNVDYDEASNTVVIEERRTAAINKDDYISLTDARHKCTNGYDILQNYTDEDGANKTATLFSVTYETIDGKFMRTSKIIFTGIPYVYFDNDYQIPLDFFNSKVLPLIAD